MTMAVGKTHIQRNNRDATVERQPVPIETELKLRAQPGGALDQVRTSSPILQCARNKGIIRRLETIYYDTTDHQLFTAGLSLRVRRSGKHFTQTIKRLPVNGPLTREEWEAAVETLAPDLGALPTAEIDGIFNKLAVHELVPIFATRVRRHAIALDMPDGQIEAAFDSGVIEAGAKQEPLSEIELELKQGKTAALYQLGLDLLDIAPLRLETQSKSGRGYALVLKMSQAAVKAVSSNLRRKDTVDEGIAKLLSGCQQQILANLYPAESGGEPEGVHQLRVALRRLRAALYFLRRELVAPSLQALETEAKRFARTLGPARNWDVFIDSTLSEIEKAGLPDIEFSLMREASAPFRDQGYREVRDGIADPQTNRFLLSLGFVIEQRSWRNDVATEDIGILAEPLTKFAARVLTRLERKALKRGRQFRHLRPEARHKLRIHLKKLRYSAEFFLPLYANGTTTKYIKQLSRLQDGLGEANDVITSRKLLSAIRESANSPDVHRAIGAVTGWQGHLELAEADRPYNRWRKFERTAPFWPC